MNRKCLCWSGRGGSCNWRLIGDLNDPPRLRLAEEGSQLSYYWRSHPASDQGGEPLDETFSIHSHLPRPPLQKKHKPITCAFCVPFPKFMAT
jgi:hypothetical protein